MQPKEWPWTSIGKINIDSVGHCTGALIESDLILTARHCLDNPRTKRLVTPRQVFFLAGYARGEFAERIAIDHFELSTLPDPTADYAHNDDWALLRLSRKSKLTPIPLALLDMETIQRYAVEGVRFFRIGYPRERPHMMRVQPGCQIAGTTSDWRAVMFDCNVMTGESGGPVLMECGGHWRLVAMTTQYLSLNRQAMSFGIIPNVAELGVASQAAVCPTE
ncbi:trypsin-like serine peptidase [Lacibacterium aquatile]|uniref:Trypsin-like serine peptidase n=1 Tax=Lacibacterium aquatile TaxID=1168082 RepID=A0ABW5DW34_9PROT